MSPDTSNDKSHDTVCAVSCDGSHDVKSEETKRVPHRRLTEQEEFEKLRAKKIVMDAILSEQCKEALKETNVKGHDLDIRVSGQRSLSENGIEEVEKSSDADKKIGVNGLDKDRSCGSDLKPRKSLEESLNDMDVERRSTMMNGNDLSNDGIVKRRVKRERRGDEGIVQTTATEEDTEGVSVSSRVKRFSLSDDQVEIAQKQGSSCPTSPCSPRPQLDGKRLVIKRSDPPRSPKHDAKCVIVNDAQVKQRSVMSVTVTTSEDNATLTHTNGMDMEQSKRPITDETESIVWRVRNRRKLKEQANVAKSS